MKNLKLSLNKEIIAELNNSDMKSVVAGAIVPTTGQSEMINCLPQSINVICLPQSINYNCLPQSIANVCHTHEYVCVPQESIDICLP